ncbi:hypothetical protein, partial [Acinetobacter sp. c3-l95]|uniref:hypothetical protein n=1 Tax=Acinetobacter sp. c3-l95 TaxID=3342804 RepID=UPI0035B7797B
MSSSTARVLISVEYCLFFITVLSQSFGSPIFSVRFITLGLMVNNTLVTVNRYLNENDATIQLTIINAKLVKMTDYYQTWQIIDSKNPPLKQADFTINERWHGYQKDIKVNQTYQIVLYQGRFDDVFLKENSFKSVN